MGTTVSSNLQLIKPDLTESIKQALPTFPGWASQNALNQDKIDSIFRNNTGTYTVNWTASGTNPTLGSGGLTEGKYVRLFPRLVIVHFRILAGGAGFATGSGQYRINAPFPFDPAIANFTELLNIGKAIFHDASHVVTSSVFGVSYSAASGLIYMRIAQGDIWSSTLPVVPGQLDRCGGYFMYPTAAA